MDVSRQISNIVHIPLKFSSSSGFYLCRITNYTEDLSKDEVRNQLSRALHIWAKESKLTFTYVPHSGNIDAENEADIVVAFQK